MLVEFSSVGIVAAYHKSVITPTPYYRNTGPVYGVTPVYGPYTGPVSPTVYSRAESAALALQIQGKNTILSLSSCQVAALRAAEFLV